MQKLLQDLEEAKQGDTGWNRVDEGKVAGRLLRKLRFLKSYDPVPSEIWDDELSLTRT